MSVELLVNSLWSSVGQSAFYKKRWYYEKGKDLVVWFNEHNNPLKAEALEYSRKNMAPLNLTGNANETFTLNEKSSHWNGIFSITQEFDEKNRRSMTAMKIKNAYYDALGRPSAKLKSI